MSRSRLSGRACMKSDAPYEPIVKQWRCPITDDDNRAVYMVTLACGHSEPEYDLAGDSAGNPRPCWACKLERDAEARATRRRD